ncbi:hypothetical protein ZWY2020_035164 [Hordeum vulgare]|nr:hypothetical protein ZWY2020_035164 [Hordeum vulgare]
MRSGGSGGYGYGGAARKLSGPDLRHVRCRRLLSIVRRRAGQLHDPSFLPPPRWRRLATAAATTHQGCQEGSGPRQGDRAVDVVCAAIQHARLQLPAVNPPCGLQLPAANHGMSNLSSLPAASHGVLDLPSQQLPAAGNQGVFDWLQDPFLTQLRSPWQDQHCVSPYAHLLYY